MDRALTHRPVMVDLMDALAETHEAAAQAGPARTVQQAILHALIARAIGGHVGAATFLLRLKRRKDVRHAAALPPPDDPSSSDAADDAAVIAAFENEIQWGTRTEGDRTDVRIFADAARDRDGARGGHAVPAIPRHRDGAAPK